MYLPCSNILFLNSFKAFNTISSSGLYLYNSCLKKSSDLLHQDINKIAEEFADNIDKCSTIGKVFNNGSNLYNMKDGFANHLRSICLIGTQSHYYKPSYQAS